MKTRVAYWLVTSCWSLVLVFDHAAQLLRYIEYVWNPGRGRSWMAGVGTGSADVHRQWHSVVGGLGVGSVEGSHHEVCSTTPPRTPPRTPPPKQAHKDTCHTPSTLISFPKHSSKKPTQKRLLPRNLAFLAAFSTFQAPTHDHWCGVQNDEHDRPNAHGLLQSGLITPKCCAYHDKCNIVEQPCKLIVHATHNADEQISMKLKKSQFHKAGSKNNIRDKLLGRLLGNSHWYGHRVPKTDGYGSFASRCSPVIATPTCGYICWVAVGFITVCYCYVLTLMKYHSEIN